MPLNERGHEVPDPTPVAWPAGVRRPETLTEQIQRLVRAEVSRAASEAGFETFEEADDFDIDDDDGDFVSPYELTVMQEEARMGRDGSNLDRVNPEVLSGKADQSRAASSESVPQPSPKDVRAEPDKRSDPEPAGGAPKGRPGGA